MNVLDDMVVALGNELSDYIEAQDTVIIKQMEKEAKSHRLPPQYLPYLWWTFFENRASWLTRSKYRSHLIQLGNILSDSNRTPDYSQGYMIPPSELESVVDATIEALGQWASRQFTAQIYQHYQKLLDKKKRAAARLTGQSVEDAKIALAAWLAVVVERHGRMLRNGDLIYTFLELFL